MKLVICVVLVVVVVVLWLVGLFFFVYGRISLVPKDHCAAPQMP